MFIQNDNNVRRSVLESANKYYILGSNFGPYKSTDYYEYYKKIFCKAQDVCFREKYSYNMFKDLPNIRYASDIVFTLDISKIKVTNSKKVIISVIDCSRKNSINKKEEYESKIIEMCEYFINSGYEVTLMSYCKFENDELAIRSILNKCKEDTRLKLNKYYYRGNIEEALNVMGDCQIIIGTRFHANILGLLLGKTIIPIAYSDKTINVLKDMNFRGKIIKMDEIEKFDVNSLTKQQLNYKHDVSYQIKDAQKQFLELDKLLINEGENGRIKNKKHN